MKSCLIFSYSSGSVPVKFINVNCSSSDSQLISCDRSDFRSCNHSDDAGIICSNQGLMPLFIIYGCSLWLLGDCVAGLLQVIN